MLLDKVPALIPVEDVRVDLAWDQVFKMLVLSLLLSALPRCKNL